MKRTTPAALVAVTLALSTVFADPTEAADVGKYLSSIPGSTNVDARQAGIQARIRESVRSGRMSRFQGQAFNQELDKIAELEATYRASHGKLTLWEQLKLLFQLDNLSRRVEQSLRDRVVADTDLTSRLQAVSARIKDGLDSHRLTRQEADGFNFELSRIQSINKVLNASGSLVPDQRMLQLSLDLDRLSGHLESTMHDRQLELPAVDKAQKELESRISSAIASGKLSAEDAKQLREEFRRIADKEATLKGYGRPLTSDETLALAVDLESLSRHLDAKVRNKNAAAVDYKQTKKKIGNRIAEGVVTGKLTLAEAHYLKSRFDSIAKREDVWNDSDSRSTTTEQKALMLDLEKLASEVERRLYDTRFKWQGAGSMLVSLKNRIDAARSAGRISESKHKRLSDELSRIQGNWKSTQASGEEGLYPLKESIYIVKSLKRLNRNLVRSLRDRGLDIPRLSQRKNAIDARIAAGIISGRLTAHEAARLIADFDRIVRREVGYRSSDSEMTDLERLSLALEFEKLSAKVERSIHEGSRISPSLKERRQKLKDDIEEGIIAGKLTEYEAGELNRELKRVEKLETSYTGISSDLTSREAITVAKDLRDLEAQVKREISDYDIAMPDVEKRKSQLLARISAGVVSGHLNRKEAGSLRREFDRIEALRRKYEGSGGMSLGEAATIAYKLERLASLIEQRMRDDQIKLPSIARLLSDCDQRLAKAVAEGLLSLDQVQPFKSRLSEIARMEMTYRYTGDGLSYPESLMITDEINKLTKRIDSTMADKKPSWTGVDERISTTSKRISDGVIAKKIGADRANKLKSELNRISKAKVAFAHSLGGFNLEETETLVRDLDRLNTELDLLVKGQRFAWSDIDRRQSNLERTINRNIRIGKIKGRQAFLIRQELDKIKRAKAAFTLTGGGLNYFERVSLGEALDKVDNMMKSQIK